MSLFPFEHCSTSFFSVTTNTLNTLGIAYQTRCHHVRLESIWNCCRWAERTKSTLQGKSKHSINMKDKKKEWTSDWIQQWYTYFQCFQIKLSSDTFKLCLLCREEMGKGGIQITTRCNQGCISEKGEFHQTKNFHTVSSKSVTVNLYLNLRGEGGGIFALSLHPPMFIFMKLSPSASGSCHRYLWQGMCSCSLWLSGENCKRGVHAEGWHSDPTQF